MAAGWITQINNFSDSDFTIRTSDGMWRPVLGGKQFQVDEPIAVPRRRTSPVVFPAPWGPITIPPGPTTLNAQYMMIGWIDWARTRIDGPAGALELKIGPMPPTGNDFLRIFDGQEVELGQVELGPRGPGSTASVDFHLNFYNPTPDPGQPADYPTGARLLWWSHHNVGADILARIDSTVGWIAQRVAGGLIDGMIGALFPKK